MLDVFRGIFFSFKSSISYNIGDELAKSEYLKERRNMMISPINYASTLMEHS
jgi:hypothetical protein